MTSARINFLNFEFNSHSWKNFADSQHQGWVLFARNLLSLTKQLSWFKALKPALRWNRALCTASQNGGLHGSNAVQAFVFYFFGSSYDNFPQKNLFCLQWLRCMRKRERKINKWGIGRRSPPPSLSMDLPRCAVLCCVGWGWEGICIVVVLE